MNEKLKAAIEKLNINLDEDSLEVVRAIIEHETDFETTLHKLAHKTGREVLFNIVNQANIRFCINKNRIHIGRKLQSTPKGMRETHLIVYKVRIHSKDTSIDFPGFDFVSRGCQSKMIVSASGSLRRKELIHIINSVYWGEYPASVLMDWWEDNKIFTIKTKTKGRVGNEFFGRTLQECYRLVSKATGD